MRVLLDTNVIVSAVTTRGLCADVLRAVLLDHELVVCPKILLELQRILQTKFSVVEELIAEYLEFLSQDTIMAEPVQLPDLPIQDKDDIEIVAAAISAKAEVLVTGDRELQEIQNVRKVRILSPRAFWEELTARGRDKA